MKQLAVLDLFSGIGGFSLGLERTGGFKTIQFVEIEPFCQKVLKKHWPEVPCHDDITTYTAPQGFADVICGGFPCQDISTAGKGAGIEGARSGLWKEYARLIGEIRPRFVLVENVAALLGRGLGVVLGDLAEIGYDAKWHCIPASAVGAPHRRDRVWIVAHADGVGCGGRAETTGRQARALSERSRGVGWGAYVAHAIGDGLQGVRADGEAPGSAGLCDGTGSDEKQDLSDDGCRSIEGARGEISRYARTAWWGAEPGMGRVAHGVPGRVDRLKSLGNAVVPQIPELLGNAILESL